MPKAKIYPETQKPRNKKDKEVTSNGSFMKMNASFMPENSSDLLKNYDTCVYCNSLGGNVLHPCACYSSSFHPNCLKNSLKDKIREKEVYIEEKGEYKYIQC